ncbi:cytochrome P450 [Flammula alnicola]|nr:cytochrome P450 [Flammula alnicola]
MDKMPFILSTVFDLNVALFGVCSAVLYLVIRRWFKFRPLSNIQGPLSPSFVFGHLIDLQHQEDAGELEHKWVSQYGEACKIAGSFGQDTLMLADPKALHHIVQASGYRYPKTPDTNQAIRLMMGRGIFWAVGDDHKRHKKVMNPAFDISRLRSFLPLFQRSAGMLAEKWKAEIKLNGHMIDVTTWISRLMLDNIGEAAFEHQFNAVDGGGVGELSDAFTNLFADSLLFPDKGTVLFTSLWRFIPPDILRYVEYLPARQVRRFRRFLKVSKQAARNVISNRASSISCDDENKDILSILVRSNSSVDAKKRLDEDELLSQMATIMLAGHDSTAMSLSWLLYDLSLNPEDQKRVREEIVSVKSQSDTPDCLGIVDFEAMTYTNAVIRETLRLHPIAFMLPRMAAEDDVIPLATPITTKTGERLSEIPIKKGQSIYMAIYTYNRLKGVWGEDADKWNPGRFLGNTKEKEYTMGMFANLLTFSGGVRGCLGWRFAVLELQATLVGLMEQFEFSPPPGIEIQGAPAGSMIPVIRGRAREGTQLPLCISALDKGERDF